MSIEAEDIERVLQQSSTGGGGHVFQIENSKLIPTLISVACVAMLAAGIALGIAISASSEADAARRQARASEMRVEGFTRALIAHNIDPYPHIKGEDP